MRPSQRLDHLPAQRVAVVRHILDPVMGLETDQQGRAFFNKNCGMLRPQRHGIALGSELIGYRGQPFGPAQSIQGPIKHGGGVLHSLVLNVHFAGCIGAGPVL